MMNLIKSVFVGIVFSLYYFPISFVGLTGINTKMALAIVGLLLLVWHWVKGRKVRVEKGVFMASVWAFLFSLISFFSVVYNNTTDNAFVFYFISMWVWMGGAYAVISLIREVHGSASLQLVFHYMAWVCAIQAILAIIIDNVSSVQTAIDGIVSQNVEYLHRTGRLYGIGASFDTAGIRFSCALLGLGYLLVNNKSNTWRSWYWILFVIIIVLGNMMSRTTIVGVIVSILYILSRSQMSFLTTGITLAGIRKFMVVFLLLGISCGFAYYMYETDLEFRSNLQYGFEGFFSWLETGEWSTSSTDKLQKMVVWPDNLRTWIIGDGWFVNPFDPDGYYMYTDIGYLRYIFYCGCIGLVFFICFFVHCTSVLVSRWKSDKVLFCLLLLIGLVVWIKVSTDIFLVYALLLMLNQEECMVRMRLFENHKYYDTQENTLLLAER